MPIVGTPDANIIRARDLGIKTLKGYAYHDVNLDIPRGKVTAICGANGSGKTSLLLTVAGRMVSNVGTLEVDGYKLPRQRRKMRRVAGLGFFKSINEVQPALKVKVLIAAELELYGMKSNKKNTQAYLEKVGIADIADKRTEELTSEEYVRFGIALGLVSDPKILVIDDIESNLTQHQGCEMMQYLRSLSSDGLTILVGITEYEIARSADCVVLLGEDARKQRDKVEERFMSRMVPVVINGSAPAAAPVIVGGAA